MSRSLREIARTVWSATVITARMPSHLNSKRQPGPPGRGPSPASMGAIEGGNLVLLTYRSWRLRGSVEGGSEKCRHRGRAVGHAQLVERAQQVGLDRRLADRQLPADLRVGQSPSDKAQHLDLTRGQPVGG